MTAAVAPLRPTVAVPSRRELLVRRLVDAPRPLVWAACTHAEHLARWIGGSGWPVDACDVDLRRGGRYAFVWRGADGRDTTLHGLFREVAEGERLVATEWWSVPALHGGLEDRPATLNALVLADAGSRTELTLRILFPGASACQAAAAVAERVGRLATYAEARTLVTPQESAKRSSVGVGRVSRA